MQVWTQVPQDVPKGPAVTVSANIVNSPIFDAPIKDVNGEEIPDGGRLIQTFQEYMPNSNAYTITEVYEHIDPMTPLAGRRYERKLIISAEAMQDAQSITYKNNTTYPPSYGGGNPIMPNTWKDTNSYYPYRPDTYPYRPDTYPYRPDTKITINPDIAKRISDKLKGTEWDNPAEDGESPEDKLHDGLVGQDCLKQCIAHLFDIPASLIPDFANNGPWEEWEDRMSEWFQQYNLTAEFIYADEANLPRKNRFIAVWETKAGTNHAIISEWDELYQSFQKVYDPQNIIINNLINIIGWISISIDDHSSFF